MNANQWWNSQSTWVYISIATNGRQPMMTFTIDSSVYLDCNKWTQTNDEIHNRLECISRLQQLDANLWWNSQSTRVYISIATNGLQPMMTFTINSSVYLDCNKWTPTNDEIQNQLECISRCDCGECLLFIYTSNLSSPSKRVFPSLSFLLIVIFSRAAIVSLQLPSDRLVLSPWIFDSSTGTPQWLIIQRKPIWRMRWSGGLCVSRPRSEEIIPYPIRRALVGGFCRRVAECWIV